jgi:hypothetical protein
MAHIPAKNGNNVLFQLAALTMPDGAQAQAIVLIDSAGNPVQSWPLPTGAASDAKLDQLLTVLQALAGKTDTQPVSLASIPLPSGAATNAKLDEILTKLNASLAVTGSFYQATQPVSAASLPLPAGAATEATAALVPAAVGAVNSAAASTDTGDFSIIALVKRGLSSLTTLLSRVPALGSQVSAGSVSVVLASNHSQIPTAVGASVLPTGAATEATLSVGVGEMHAAVVAVEEVRDRLPASPHSQPLTDAQLRATPVPITGSLSMDPDLSSAREVTQQDVRALIDTVGLLVEAIRNQMPMPDSADRMRVNIETGSVGIASNQTLATVTTVGTLSNQTNVGGYSAAGAAFADFNTPALTNVAKLVVIS